MRACKILSAIIVAVMMLSVPLIIVADTSDASVDERSSAVYFKSNADLNPDVLAKYMTVDVSASSIQNILSATADFNFETDGFTISEIKTGKYNVEAGIATRISENRYQEDYFKIISIDIEFKLKANNNDSKLFVGNFDGDASYGFIKSVSVKQNDVMTFKGTLKTELSNCKEQHAISNDGTYVIKDIKDDSVEKTELVLDAVYTSANGMEQTFRFSSSFIGYSTKSMSNGVETKDIKSLALGDIYSADTVVETTGKGHVSMETESRTYTGESKADSFQTVYNNVQKIDVYSGKQTCTYTSEVLMTEKQYNALYEGIKLKDLFDRFTGTDQELKGQIGTIGTMDVNNFEKVDERADAVISDVKGEEQKDTSKQIANAAIAVLVAVIVVMIAAICLIKRKKRL